MPTTGTKQQQKIHSLIEGKKILNDTSSLLKEILSLLATGAETGNVRDLKKLPIKIKLLMKGVDQVNVLLDCALKLDGSFRVAKDLMSSSIADENQQRVISDRLQQTTNANKRKSLCEQRLNGYAQQVSIVSPPAMKKTKNFRSNSTHGTEESIATKLLKYEAPKVHGSRYIMMY